MFFPCRFSFRLFPLFLPPSAFRASTLYRYHSTSHPVPIPYTPVLHFATKPQHSLSCVEKMSNFCSVMSEKVCKILLCPPPPAWGTPSRRGICDVDFSLSFYLIFHSRKNGSRLAYVPSVFSLATEPKRYTTESGDGIAPRMSKVRL